MTSTVQYIGWMEISRRAANGALALAILLLSTFGTTRSAQAQTFTVLYAFTGGADGENPTGSLVGDTAGNLYGTTTEGGASGYGTVFKLDRTGKETVLHSFGGEDGLYPWAGLIRDAAGNLYGTTSEGGASGYGTVFKLTLKTSGKYQVLHSFAGDPDAASPYASLIRDVAGNLYGTTSEGGASGHGTVFKLDATGNYEVLYSFAGDPDAASPYASLIRDAAGDLYGTTRWGGDDKHCGAGCGTVFKLDATSKETVLYRFTGARDGEFTYAGLIRDAAGNLYGTTFVGGASGHGTVFKLDATGKYEVLYSFAGADGAYPLAGLIRDAAGNLYGTTAEGGDYDGGTVFKLDATSKKIVLHSFAGSDGTYPHAGLIRDAAGNLYGTTTEGGDLTCDPPSGCGTVFKLAP